MKKTTYFDWTVRGLSMAIAGGAVLTIGVAANAQPGPDAPERGPERFIERADSNGDGNVTLEELNAMHATQTAKHFARMDSNGDGVINSEDPRPEPPEEGNFGPRGERPRGNGDFGPRGDRPRGDGEFGRRGDRPRGDGEFGRRGERPRGDGEFGRRGDRPRPDHDAGPRGKRGGVFMEKADTDGDGGVSLTELQAVRPDATQEDFDKRDVNGDGVLNRDDRKEAFASRRGGGHAKGADGRGPRGPHGSRGMMNADANEDGNITLEELQAANIEATAKRFSERDTNNDGVLNQDDAPQGKRGGRGPRGHRGASEN